jgi:uncharacterized SAM-binding protein YcdF (DUF218 family)
LIVVMDTIFFILSKIVQFCIKPLNWVIIFIFLGLFFSSLRKPYLCKRFLVFALLDLLIVGWLPTSESLVRILEDRVTKSDLASISEKDLGGIIILGGAIHSGRVGPDRGEVSLGAAAERVTKAFELMRKYPDLPFIFSGYSDKINPQGISESEAFKQLVFEQGFADRVGYYENQSRNTYENVVFMKPMIAQIDKSDPPKPWLLVTSARHMYRSVLIFRNQGVDVIPMPVDYQTGNSLRWDTFDLEEGAYQWNKLIHESVGLAAYRIAGKL